MLALPRLEWLEAYPLPVRHFRLQGSRELGSFRKQVLLWEVSAAHSDARCLIWHKTWC